MNAPIRVRLTAWYVVVLAVVLVGIGAFVVVRLRTDLTSEVDRSLATAGAQIAEGYEEDGPREFPAQAREVLPGGIARSAAQIIDPQGRVTLSVGVAATQPLLDADGLDRARSGQRVTDSGRFGAAEVHLRVQATAISGGQVLVVAGPLDEVDRSVRSVLVLLSVGGVAALAVVAVSGWWIARKALSPVEQMTRQADRIGIAALSERIPAPRANDELGHLARTLNAMLDRLQDGVAARERLIADASHELRTPLAAMRTELEVSLRHDVLDDDIRAVLESARDEAVSMARIVDNLLTLARADEGQLDVLIADEDLRAVAETVVAGFDGLAGAAGVSVTCVGQHARTAIDRHRIEHVVRNLVDNAVRASPAGGTVTVTVWQTSASVGLTVADDGPGVAPEARERIFERFTREDPARTRDGGAGLGLAICRQIVRAHAGDIHVEPRTPQGSAFVVTLPCPAGPVAAAASDYGRNSIESPNSCQR